MAHDRKFRFAMQLRNAPSGEAWIARVRRAEVEGYDVVSMPDHLTEQFAPVPALSVAAAVSSRVKLSMFVLANDLRHPAVLAKEIATLDHLSGGRVELGLGAGWMESEYKALGVRFDPPGTRIRRLGEAITVMKGLFAGAPFSHSGEFYEIVDHDLYPKPANPGGIPFVIGGGGKKMLTLAVQHGDIIGISNNNSARTAEGALSDGLSYDVVRQQIDWVREAAGDRFDDFEINLRVLAVASDEADAARVSASFGSTPEIIATSPFTFFGSPAQIEDKLFRVREDLGVSYYGVSQRHADFAAPIIERMAGR
jgi:probable F420-dependent oxidoreductase